MNEDTPIFEELRERWARDHYDLSGLRVAVFRAHEDEHEGPIRYCTYPACVAYVRQSVA